MSNLYDNNFREIFDRLSKLDYSNESNKQAMDSLKKEIEATNIEWRAELSKLEKDSLDRHNSEAKAKGVKEGKAQVYSSFFKIIHFAKSMGPVVAIIVLAILYADDKLRILDALDDRGKGSTVLLRSEDE